MVGAIAVSTFLPPQRPLVAVELGDGSTMFNSPPRLVSFTTTENIAGRRNATYYVTLDLLPNAGESLQSLTVELIEGRFTRLDYAIDDIEIFEGDRANRGPSYAIAAASYDQDTQIVTIDLGQPVPPGRMVTLALPPERNPSRAGVYLFEIAAAPEGEEPVFQRVGTGRLNIFESYLP
jgi:hypothetical protein